MDKSLVADVIHGVERGMKTCVVHPNCNFPNKYIVAGFPGTGKSFGGKYFPNEFLDMESSDYHWIHINGTGGKVCNPDWPNNYLDAVEKAYNETVFSGTIFCVCTSTHSEVLKGLHERGLRFIAICPKDKEETIRRYKERGSSEAFIENLDKNFENFRNDVLNSHAQMVICTDEYVVDVMSYFAEC